MPTLTRRVAAFLIVAGLPACGQQEVAEDNVVTEIAEADPGANLSGSDEPDAPQAAPKDVTVAPSAIEISDEAVKAEISPAVEACLNTGDAARGVSYAMGGCFNEELTRQDERLNAAYRAAMDRLGKPERAALQAEERKWIARRDQTCAEERMGGTIDLINVPQCLVEETIRRRMVLERMAV